MHTTANLNPVDAISTYFLKIHFNITNMMLLSYKKKKKGQKTFRDFCLTH